MGKRSWGVTGPYAAQIASFRPFRRTNYTPENGSRPSRSSRIPYPHLIKRKKRRIDLNDTLIYDSDTSNEMESSPKIVPDIKIRGRARASSTVTFVPTSSSAYLSPLTPFTPVESYTSTPLPHHTPEVSFHPEAPAGSPVIARPDTPPLPDPQVLRIRTQLEDAHNQLSAALSERDRAMSEEKKWKDAMQEEKTRSAEFERSLTEERYAGKAREAEQADTIKRHKAEVRSLEDDIVRYHETIRAKGNEVSDAWKRVESIEITLRHCKTREEASRLKLDDAEKENEALEEAALDRSRLHRREIRQAEAARMAEAKEVKKMKEELDILRADKVALVCEMEQLRQGVEVAQSAANAAQTQLDSLTAISTTNNVGKTLAAIEERKRLEKELRSIQEKRNLERADLHTEYEIRIHSLERKVSEAKQAEEAKNAEISRLEEDCDIHSQARYQLELDIEEEKSIRKDLEIEVGRLNLALEVSKNQLAELASCTPNIEPDTGSVARITDLEVCNDDLQAKVIQLVNDLQENEGLAQAQAGTNRLLCERLSVMTQRYMEQHGLNKQHEVRRDQLECIQAGLKTSLTSLGTKNRQHTDELSARACWITALEHDLIGARTAEQAIRNEVEHLRTKNENLQSKIGGSLGEKVNDPIQPGLQQLMNDLDKLRGWNEQHQAAAKRYRREREMLRGEKSHMVSRINALEDSIRQKEEELKHRQKLIDNMIERMEIAETSARDGQADLENVKTQNRRLWADKTISTEPIVELRERIQVLEGVSKATITSVVLPKGNIKQSHKLESGAISKPTQLAIQRSEDSKAGRGSDPLKSWVLMLDSDNAMLRNAFIAGSTNTKSPCIVADVKTISASDNDADSLRGENADLRLKIDQQVEYNPSLLQQMEGMERVLDHLHPGWRGID